MKVIIDFVPNHTARRYHSDKAPEGVKDLGAEDDTTFFFKQNNNYYYIPNQKFTPSLPESSGKQTYFEFPAKATGNDCFSAFCGEYDWYETAKLNYGVDYGDHSTHFNPTPDTWLKMYSILKYWASMGVDGFRCDMVFMVPVHFWNWVITRIKKDFPDLVFIGEIYDVAQYREFLNYGLFDYLYDKVNLYDTLKGIETSGYSAAKLTDCWKAVDGIGHRMLNFLENHDEVRFASPEFAGDSSRIVPHLVVSTMMSKGPVMIYYGQELGEPGADNEGFAGNNNRTTIFDYWSVDTLRRWYNEGKCNEQLLTAHEKWIRNLYAKVLNLCNRSAAIREGMFFDLMYANLQNPDFDPHSQYCWLRYTDEELLLILVNFCDEKRDVKINIPDLAFDMAAIEEGAYVTTDELWGNLHKVSVSKNTPLSLPVKAHDAVIIKLNKQNQ